MLVILGLLVGGILTGKSLIEAASIHKQLKQFDKITTAYNTFRDKYQGIPGDMCTNAAAFGLVCGNAAGGKRDDGILNSFGSGPPVPGEFSTAYESAYFFGHLINAKLLEGSFSTAGSGACPTWPAGGLLSGERHHFATSMNPQYGMAAIELKGVKYLFLGPDDCTNLGITGAPTVTPEQAYALDRKIDDGIPSKGKIMAVRPDSSSGWATIDGTLEDAPATGCVSDVAGTNYNTSNTNFTCRLLVTLSR